MARFMSALVKTGLSSRLGFVGIDPLFTLLRLAEADGVDAVFCFGEGEYIEPCVEEANGLIADLPVVLAVLWEDEGCGEVEVLGSL